MEQPAITCGDHVHRRQLGLMTLTACARRLQTHREIVRPDQKVTGQRLPLRPGGHPMVMTEIGHPSGEPIGFNRAPWIGRNGRRDRVKCDKTAGSSTRDASQSGAPRLAATR